MATAQVPSAGWRERVVCVAAEPEELPISIRSSDMPADRRCDRDGVKCMRRFECCHHE